MAAEDKPEPPGTPELADPSADGAAPATPAADGTSPGGSDTALSPEEQAAKEAAERESAEREAALNRLMLRISKNSNFPSLKESIRSIQKVARSDTAHRRVFTDHLLDDVALTAKLLRLINAAYYSSVGAGSITSIDRALSLMGFQAVGMLAGSLMLFEKMPKGPGSENVKRTFNRALLSGLLAQEFCHSTRHFEGAYLTALFMNLGQMLVEMHFPEDAQELRQQMDDWAAENPGADDAHAHEALQRLSRQLMGLSCEDIGIEVARQWGWPEDLTQGLRRHYPSDPEQAASREEYMRVLCTAATELSGRLHDLPKARNEDQRKEDVSRCLRDFGRLYAGPLSLDAEALPETGVGSLQRWESLSETLGFTDPPVKGKAAAGATRKPPAQASHAPSADGRHANKPKPAAPADPPSKSGQARPPTAAPARPQAATSARLDPGAQDQMTRGLSQALSEISNWALGEMPLDAMLDRTAQMLMESLGAQRVVIALRQGPDGALVGRLGKGVRAGTVVNAFVVPLQPPQDVFGILCTHGRDTLISDTRDPVVSARLPAWFQKDVRAGTFLLLPMALSGKPLGLIYADKEDPASLSLTDQDLTLLKALRNQLVMAVRLRSSLPPA
jgi:HD-like signal output (HDOD) protein